ncbi:MAG: adenylate cyclase [Desulfuromonas sp.]|uniref:CYTH domain-containing protein n=1 Tax=Desulfuromonas sp. TaxID=892 RepID=UPI000CCB4D63|nr:CYTH domain-containing protein [Desulfuromonas sp.]PLX82826.1 MAG: adenylate cyclase [Desulfuromonas sp.]
MGVEIERKFLVRGDAWRAGAEGIPVRQGYLSVDPPRAVRVRQTGKRGFLTIKGKTEGISRTEFEYPIPLEDAEELLEHLCLRPLIEKVRYRVPHAGLLWEVDEFLGENTGLILAEVELESAAQEVPLPPWAGREVSEDPRYFNAALARHPFTDWEAKGEP